MRPGRKSDAERIWALLLADARAGVIDQPGRAWLARLMEDFDWDTHCRVIEGPAGIEAALLVLDRPTLDGTVTRLVDAGPSRSGRARLRGWALALSAALDGRISQVWRARGRGAELEAEGFRLERTFWRMDLSSLAAKPAHSLPEGYRLVSEDSSAQSASSWVAAYNSAFAEHWRHSPLTVEAWQRRQAGRDSWLTLAAVRDELPAAVVFSSLERYDGDPRRQPVGVVESVGTLPEHRRRGLALALTAEAVSRLRRRGAGSSSLYVDAGNRTRAVGVYRRLGYELGLELEVFEYAQGR